MHPLKIIKIRNAVCECAHAASSAVFSDWVVGTANSKWIYSHTKPILKMDTGAIWYSTAWYSHHAEERQETVLYTIPSIFQIDYILHLNIFHCPVCPSDQCV